MADYSKARLKFVNYIISELNGKSDNYNTIIGSAPLAIIYSGFLHPTFQNYLENEEADFDDDDASDSTSSEDEITTIKPKQLKKRRTYLPPSSAGLSFYVIGEEIELEVMFNGSYYIKEGEKDSIGRTSRRETSGEFSQQKWVREYFHQEPESLNFYPTGVTEYEIFKGKDGLSKAKIVAKWRKYHKGYIITISLANTQKYVEYEKEEINEKTIFNLELKCIVRIGKVGDYPKTNYFSLSKEERENEFRYRDVKMYAIGHGVSVDWNIKENNAPEIWIDFIPKVEVPQVAVVKDDGNWILSTKYLMQKDSNNLINELTQFVNSYNTWISGQEDKLVNFNEDQKSIASQIIKKQKIAKQKMLKSIQLLSSNPKAKLAFSLANEAIFLQNNSQNTSDKKNFIWRPFQLAFILTSLESTLIDSSSDRDTLDLIWFPTGGGKTEAYLGLTAILLIYRRLKYPSSSLGTAVIMRYTLRLLSTDQFIRASKIIIALELIRLNNIDLLGNEKFTIGLWVGGASSPNTRKQVSEIIKLGNQNSKLVLTHCPWCNHKFKKDSYVLNNKFFFRCLNPDCNTNLNNFEGLPINVVDDELYEAPPSLLIGTVDKFAQVTLNEKTHNFFNYKGNRPPELIIQDELHLISGALGSIVGLYETSFDTIIQLRDITAKYIASTATIKNANEQTILLYGRKADTFPPPGLSFDDSYFSKTVSIEHKPGRLYLGFLTHNKSKSESIVPLIANLLAAPQTLFNYNEEELLEAWWTQIVYHGSIKGLQNTQNLFYTELNKEYIRIILNSILNFTRENFPNVKLDKFKNLSDFEDFIHKKNLKSQEDLEFSKGIELKFFPLRNLRPEVLISSKGAEDNNRLFKKLELSKNENNCIESLLATNIIATGLDVERLALMIVSGQPLTTSEYIQSTSRVGRGRVPGIVFVNYFKTQTRSLAYYENFRPYHESFYRFVEPTSLTPFTYQARKRALHAAIVNVIRHGVPQMLMNASSRKFDKKNDKVLNAIEKLKTRIKKALPKQDSLHRKIDQHIDEILDDWEKIILINNNNNRGANLSYSQQDNKDNGPIFLLTTEFNLDSDSWPTLNSMRNVENNSIIITKTEI